MLEGDGTGTLENSGLFPSQGRGKTLKVLTAFVDHLELPYHIEHYRSSRDQEWDRRKKGANEPEEMLAGSGGNNQVIKHDEPVMTG